MNIRNVTINITPPKSSIYSLMIAMKTLGQITNRCGHEASIMDFSNVLLKDLFINVDVSWDWEHDLHGRLENQMSRKYSYYYNKSL